MLNSKSGKQKFIISSNLMPLVSFYSTLKTPAANKVFSEVCRGYRKRPVSWNELIHSLNLSLTKDSKKIILPRLIACWVAFRTQPNIEDGVFDENS